MQFPQQAVHSLLGSRVAPTKKTTKQFRVGIKHSANLPIWFAPLAYDISALWHPSKMFSSVRLSHELLPDPGPREQWAEEEVMEV